MPGGLKGKAVNGNSVLTVAMALAALPAMGSAQTGTGQPRFEVTSVKPAGHEDGPSFARGGPGTGDPELITEDRASLLSLIHRAYNPAGHDALHGLDWDQISGPAWLGSERYSVVAKVPPGTTKEQLRLMWQDLLAERFGLKLHFTTKDFTVYELSVARNGPKLRKADEGPERQEPGFPVLAPGTRFGRSIVPPRNVLYTFRDYSMAEFIQLLAIPLSEESAQLYAGAFTVAKVIDKTGLDGQYDFTFEFAGRMYAGGAFPPPLPDGETDTAPTLLDALQQQLGLQLEKKKAKLDVLVVDHVDKVPTEN
jgi:uncharacterized protein (TIGR03435 family)